ncbi:hypothetical protein WAI453_012001 [Rhynchosporium graminicola]|uniref:Related to GPI anchored cell wall protein n=1 Tax=Rhynchosporium graminicola TaxID=2792576 RepID=A0A1E1KJN8_9HELO|nr:related to GPI anchored cell wall protein [Rhynchosporium commune]
MRYYTSLAFGLGASASILPRDTCTFTLTASGGQSGIVGQLSDGQNRIGGGNSTGIYTINNGKITDAKGRGCILRPPTRQLQCDVGATPTGGFSIGSNGEVRHDGSSTFYACPASDSMYNIYTSPVSGQDKCVEIHLAASDCYKKPTKPVEQQTTDNTTPQTQTVIQTVKPSCPAPDTKTITDVKTVEGPTVTQVKTVQGPTVTEVKKAEQSCPAPKTVVKTVPGPAVTVTQPVSPPAASVTQPAQDTPAPSPKPSTIAAAPSPKPSTGNTCPADLSGNYQYPHLIVPVSKSNKDKSYGTSYNGKIDSDVSTIFNFDIPSSYTGTCSLVFLFPKQDQLETSSFTFSGNGEFKFSQLSNVASQSTTYGNQGSHKTDYGVKTATPGSSVVVSTFACPAGQAVSYEISSASGSSLEFFQDYNPSPIGLYITSC